MNSDSTDNDSSVSLDKSLRNLNAKSTSKCIPTPPPALLGRCL